VLISQHGSIDGCDFSEIDFKKKWVLKIIRSMIFLKIVAALRIKRDLKSIEVWLKKTKALNLKSFSEI